MVNYTRKEKEQFDETRDRMVTGLVKQLYNKIALHQEDTMKKVKFNTIMLRQNSKAYKMLHSTVNMEVCQYTKKRSQKKADSYVSVILTAECSRELYRTSEVIQENSLVVLRINDYGVVSQTVITPHAIRRAYERAFNWLGKMPIERQILQFMRSGIFCTEAMKRKEEFNVMPGNQPNTWVYYAEKLSAVSENIGKNDNIIRSYLVPMESSETLKGNK